MKFKIGKKEPKPANSAPSSPAPVTPKKHKSKKKIILIVVIVLAAVIGGCVAYSAYAVKNAPVTVKTQKLSKGDLKRTVSADGQVVSPYTEQVSNSSAVPIYSVDVALGNYVNQGDRLATLYSKEEDKWSYVTATTSGTVTAINAVVGAPASGVLFTLQRTDNLRINMQIKESDINTITGGMAVNITTDATGSRVYTGTVQSIAPTSSSTSSGSDSGTTSSSSAASAASTGSTGKVTFNAVVSIDSPQDGLHIGMKTKQEVVVEEKTDALNVPFDAVVKDSQGNNQIFVVQKDANGKMTAKAVPITLGIQTDSAVAVTGTDLSEGQEYITNPSNITDGQSVTTEDAQTSAAAERA